MDRNQCYPGSTRVIKLCPSHYDMIRNMHNDVCCQRPSPQAGYYPCVQPIDPKSCQSYIPVSDPCQASADPFDRVGQSETLYLSSTSPCLQQQPAYDDMAKKCETYAKPREERGGTREETLETKIRLEMKMHQDAQQQSEKIKQMEAAISPEALEAKIREEIKRNKDEQQKEDLIKQKEDLIKQLEAANYRSTRPEPQFRQTEKWQLMPQYNNAKDIEEVKRKRIEMFDQPSKEEFFECRLPPKDDSGLPNNNSRPKDDSRQGKETKFRTENQVIING